VPLRTAGKRLLHCQRWPTDGTAHAKYWKSCVEAFEKAVLLVTQQRLGSSWTGLVWIGVYPGSARRCGDIPRPAFFNSD
jgi:hypothetical protein